MGFWRGFTRPARYAVLLAGAVPVFAFPSLNLEFLAWFGLVPGLLLLRLAPSAREAAIRGWWLGAGYMSAAVYWLLPNLGPGLLLVVIVLGAPWAGVGLAAWSLLRAPRAADVPGPAATPDQATPPATSVLTSAWRRLFSPAGASPLRSLAALFVVPSCWVLVDYIRSWQGIGGPWAVFGASQWQHPVVLSLAAVGGIWLISFVLMAANTGIALALTGASLSARTIGAVATGLAIAVGPVAYALTADEYAIRPTGHVTLALVQPDFAPRGRPMATVDEEVKLTLGIHSARLVQHRRGGIRGVVPPGQHRADLIVWGESSVGFDLDTYHALLDRLERLSAKVGTQLLVSQDALSPSGAQSKVAVLLGPGGIEATYTKSRLVPFGEYIPFRSALGWLAKISRAAPQNMTAGPGARVLRVTLPDGRPLSFGVLICFESSFPDMSRVDANNGAQVIIYQTSDSTFQGSWAPEQHASLAALRAAETGRPAVQAALTGDTAAFDTRGRELAWAGTSEHGVVIVTLALPPAWVRTPFDRFGDYVPWTCIGILVIAGLIGLNATGFTRRLRGLGGRTPWLALRRSQPIASPPANSLPAAKSD